MKPKLKIFKLIALFTLFSTFFSCQEDEISVENENQSFHLKTSRLSINQVINEITNKQIKQKLQITNLSSSHNNSLFRSNNSSDYFIKKEKDDELTTYILNLNSYSQLKPYFLKLIITKNKNETEKMGFLKYIPTNPVSSLDLTNFTGKIEILDTNFQINATSEYVNGIKQISNQSNSVSNRMACTDELLITEVRCSNGGNHGVGDTCYDSNFNIIPNDAYYVVSIFTRCNGDRTTPTQIIEDTSNPTGGTSSFSNTAYLYYFVNSLSQEELAIYVANPSIQDFLVQNLIVAPIPNCNPMLGGDCTQIIIKPEAEQFTKELIDLANNEEDEELIPNLINLSIVTKQNGYFENSFDTNYYNLINPYTEVDTQAYNPLWSVYFTTQCAIARYKLSQEPEWNNLYGWQQDAWVYWEASKEMLHLGLDLIGLVPVVGEVADLTNGVIYTIEGDGVNATLSFASTIPIAGWFSAGVKFAKRADGLAYTVKAANNLISFGAYNSKKFRQACGIAIGDATKQAHHIIPRGSQIIEHEVVQRAAKATTNQGFHIDQALNGIAVATWRNQPNHHQYNNKIYDKLQFYIQQNPNATPTQCYNQLMIILNQAKQAIINNPNVHLNNLNF